MLDRLVIVFGMLAMVAFYVRTAYVNLPITDNYVRTSCTERESRCLPRSRTDVIITGSVLIEVIVVYPLTFFKLNPPLESIHAVIAPFSRKVMFCPLDA